MTRGFAIIQPQPSQAIQEYLDEEKAEAARAKARRAAAKVLKERRAREAALAAKLERLRDPRVLARVHRMQHEYLQLAQDLPAATRRQEGRHDHLARVVTAMAMVKADLPEFFEPGDPLLGDIQSLGGRLLLMAVDLEDMRRQEAGVLEGKRARAEELYAAIAEEDPRFEPWAPRLPPDHKKEV